MGLKMHVHMHICVYVYMCRYQEGCRERASSQERARAPFAVFGDVAQSMPSAPAVCVPLNTAALSQFVQHRSTSGNNLTALAVQLQQLERAEGVFFLLSFK